MVYTLEADIKAPPHRVWEFVSDVGVPPRFSGELQRAEWRELTGPDESPAAGSIFEGFNKRGDNEWSLPQLVTTWEPGVEFAWSAGATSEADAPAATWRYTLEKIPGGTRLRHLVTLGPGPSGLTAAIDAMPDREAAIIAGRSDELKANMQATVEGIRDLAEAGRGPSTSSFPTLT